MGRKTKIIGILTAVSTSMVAGYSLVFELPSAPTISVIDGQQLAKHLVCYENAAAPAIDQHGQLEVLVWNIYKQNRPNWQSELTQYTQSSQLVLLQEASLTPEFIRWIKDTGLVALHVDAFKAFNVPAGVSTLSHSAPLFSCAYTEKEPWIRLPKSGLYSLYPLSNGQKLAVVNLHAINFTYGTKDYFEQIKALIGRLHDHDGPVIIAGDFNSWSAARLKALKKNLHKINVEEAQFAPDNRKLFINVFPLDHLFYRGLTLESAKAPVTTASDHNPLIVRFRLGSDS